jgi:Uma2 family endonuclease
MDQGKSIETAFTSDERFTQAQFIEWLDRYEATLTGSCELIDGAIVMAPPASYPHGDVAAQLIVAIGSHANSRGIGRVYESSTGFELPTGDTVAPDVAFISNERYAIGPAPLPGEMLRIVPDLAIEVLSPSTAVRDRTEKKTAYARSGVNEYWLVDSKTRCVVVHSLVGDAYDAGIEHREGLIRSGVLPGLSLAVREVFSRLSSSRRP